MEIQLSALSNVAKESCAVQREKSRRRACSNARPVSGDATPQALLFAGMCPCFEHPIACAGLCRACYQEQVRSTVRFAGNRESVLRRDHRQCRCCGTARQIIVHHRSPGIHEIERLITLCAACHARIHRSASLWRWVPALVAELWQEMHASQPLQLQFSLLAVGMIRT